MQELTIISGKGGTGKTSVAASFAVLAGPHAVVADCDVDAADLHLVLAPLTERETTFISGHEARIRQASCDACGWCAQLCRFQAIHQQTTGDQAPAYAVDPFACEGCGLCVRQCPQYAIEFDERECGTWYVSRSRLGPFLHARLLPGGENSGKLVSLLREQARTHAREEGRSLVLIDGSPGIGCPVIASLTNSSLALIVAEPTVTGLHDLERIAQVTARLAVPAAVAVNKWDLNREMTERIETYASAAGLLRAGRIRYDDAVTQAQIAGLPVVEHTTRGTATDIRNLWRQVQDYLTTVPGDSSDQPVTNRI